MSRLDTFPDVSPDRRPRLLVCGVGDRDCDRSWGSETVARLSEEDWSPPDAVTVTLEVSTDDDGLSAISGAMSEHGCAAVLLVGSGGDKDTFSVQMRAENRRGGDSRLAPRIRLNGPGVARATAPVAEMVRALKDAGIGVHTSSDAAGGADNYVLYRVLTEVADGPQPPAVGLIQTPSAMTDDERMEGLKTAVSAFARRLSARITQRL